MNKNHIGLIDLIESKIKKSGIRDDREYSIDEKRIREYPKEKPHSDFTFLFRSGIITGFIQGGDCGPVDLTDGGEGTVLPECDRIGPEAFKNCGVLRSVKLRRKNYQMASEVFACCKNLEHVSLPEGMEHISMETFSGCTHLSTVELPQSLRSIHMCAFERCSKLYSIELPPNLREIENYSFFGCKSLREIILPDTLTELGEDSFANCVSLREVRFGSGLVKIERCTFQNCFSLESIEIPEGVTHIEFGAFAGCRGLKRVKLPSTLEKVDPYAFYDCTALEVVEHPRASEFDAALCRTLYWNNLRPHYPRRPQVPMDLLNYICGIVTGAVLTTRGYTWFDPDMSCQIFQTNYPDVWEVRVWRKIPGQDDSDILYDYYLMDGNLHPIRGARSIQHITYADMVGEEESWRREMKDVWNRLKDEIFLI